MDGNDCISHIPVLQGSHRCVEAGVYEWCGDDDKAAVVVVGWWAGGRVDGGSDKSGGIIVVVSGVDRRRV